MSNKNFDLDSEFDYEMSEIDERFGGNFSEMTSKAMKRSSPKKNKVIKFHKDGHFDKNHK